MLTKHEKDIILYFQLFIAQIMHVIPHIFHFFGMAVRQKDAKFLFFTGGCKIIVTTSEEGEKT